MTRTELIAELHLHSNLHPVMLVAADMLEADGALLELLGEKLAASKRLADQLAAALRDRTHALTESEVAWNVGCRCDAHVLLAAWEARR